MAQTVRTNQHIRSSIKELTGGLFSNPFQDAKIILTVRDTDENWFGSWYKFHLKMYEDVNRANGGFFRSYGSWFMSIGLSGQKWKTHMKVGKYKNDSVAMTVR